MYRYDVPVVSALGCQSDFDGSEFHQIGRVDGFVPGAGRLRSGGATEETKLNRLPDEQAELTAEFMLRYADSTLRWNQQAYEKPANEPSEPPPTADSKAPAANPSRLLEVGLSDAQKREVELLKKELANMKAAKSYSPLYVKFYLWPRVWRWVLGG